ncbi:hypothetical protein [Photobacterium leiognathi]|uniref:hypothetical protein n=1 Tax=Photobacterium leiognathi TaxID=553611 RepID=UPI00273A32F0|nr:hypothetical protein [Photobacterium leiognathi]
MLTQLYYELMEDNSGYAFIGGEPEYFRSLVELHQIGNEFYPDGYDLHLVTSDNWQQLYDMGVFDNDCDC